MICANCGQNIPDGVKFCSHCGTKVQGQAKQFCTTCGAECAEGQLFCNVCGTKFAERQISAGSGKLLKTIGMVSMYNGEPTVGVAASTGQLLVYDDRIEFKKKMGNALTSSFGVIGLISSAKSVKKDPVEIFPVNQISELKVGAYMGLYNTLVIRTRDGMVKSFCPALPGSSDAKDIVEFLRPYM